MATDQPRDLTAERAAKLAAFELVKKLTNNAGMDPNARWDKVNQLLVYRQTARQDALREAAKVARNHRDTGDRYTSSNRICVELDRLASEGG